MTDPKAAKIARDALALRFGEDFSIDEPLQGLDEIARIAARSEEHTLNSSH